MARKKKVTPLTGEDLLNQVKQLGDLSKEEKARACGYIMTTKTGKSRVNIMKFQNALLDAMGMDLEGGGSGEGRGGRKPSYRTRVQSNKNLLIGAAYTAQMGLEPGDEFEITLGRKHIKLVKLEAEEEEA
ncbi:AbrB family transcriptional regulator [filamentous cyanobacterium LEGE 11480]|uniref:AbrB family transcriptional regulator n=1 Tax=Romeriopsis navalis LEGE 11480 TaxID=2777977 RepID=A0A928Z3A9_9CYAN|nr:AbrB family transcriptional regulator [Romeriopsis navalis]MBE9030469.1 AbrB family transcriptional regulator [Romeriopsis navalis LEGE 11480]